MKDHFNFPNNDGGTPTLFVCAIPIGHVGDMTVRVRSCLMNTAVIFCEDTRQAQACLLAQGIWTNQRLIRMDQHQEKASFVQFDRCIATESVAYMTDAGSPAVSDPGAMLVAHARRMAIPVVTLPGPSALTAFLSGAGVLCHSFHFGGFFPRKLGDQDRQYDARITRQEVGIWLESPHRIVATIQRLSARYPSVEVVLAKELTKPHERYIFGTAMAVHSTLQSMDVRGEWIMMVDARSYVTDEQTRYNTVAKELKKIGILPKQIKPLSGVLSLNKNQLYEAYLRA